MAPAIPTATDNLYHLLLSVSALGNNQISEKISIIGTYTSLAAAKVAAHNGLHEAGYERSLFIEYETDVEFFEAENIPERSGLVVFARSPDGTTFRVRIKATPNIPQVTTLGDDEKIPVSLFYVIETVIQLDKANRRISLKDSDVQGVFTTYQDARAHAEKALIDEDDGVTEESFLEYVVAPPGEMDCGCGENVIVHAIGDYGENYYISIIQALEKNKKATMVASLRAL
ncbi:hypothetical protein BJX63DRAFT_379519 [Aspergillus granulosus]|uniref:Uncharacterized protein n=1 Tax=Aspergillus granulosus TaxID=176169 RepID=A0ABR4I1G5_9EURO